MSQPQPVLYECIFVVRPTPAHPKFYELQFGCLSLFVFDIDPTSARDRALGILKFLPWETASEEFVIVECAPDWPPIQYQHGLPAKVDMAVAAHNCGFAVFLSAAPIGEDEPDLKHWLKGKVEGQ